MELIVDPTAHQSNDPQDMFNNVCLFVVREDTRAARRNNYVPTEMHIFQCVRVSAQNVVEDLHHFIKGNFKRVRPGIRGGPAPVGNFGENGGGGRNGIQDEIPINSAEYFEMDVVGSFLRRFCNGHLFSSFQNTLNRCFDDIERFVARIQSAAIAQRELELQQHRLRNRSSSKKSAREAVAAAQHGILQLRAQMPSYNEFFEVFQKFKLSFNLLVNQVLILVIFFLTSKF